MSEISPTKNSISVAIRFFKRQTTVSLRTIIPHFSWQPNYHDHIIRNEDELNRIREYIFRNPENWKQDFMF
jgi:REP element-mobilizing transposase RayT